VLELIAAKPEHRATEAFKILAYMSIPAFSSYVWVRSQLTALPVLSMFASSAVFYTFSAAFAPHCSFFLRPHSGLVWMVVGRTVSNPKK
jgi:hypothetical protein